MESSQELELNLAPEFAFADSLGHIEQDIINPLFKHWQRELEDIANKFNGGIKITKIEVLAALIMRAKNDPLLQTIDNNTLQYIMLHLLEFIDGERQDYPTSWQQIKTFITHFDNPSEVKRTISKYLPAPISNKQHAGKFSAVQYGFKSLVANKEQIEAEHEIRQQDPSLLIATLVKNYQQFPDYDIKSSNRTHLGDLEFWLYTTCHNPEVTVKALAADLAAGKLRFAEFQAKFLAVFPALSLLLEHTVIKIDSVVATIGQHNILVYKNFADYFANYYRFMQHKRDAKQVLWMNNPEISPPAELFGMFALVGYLGRAFAGKRFEDKAALAVKLLWPAIFNKCGYTATELALLQALAAAEPIIAAAFDPQQSDALDTAMRLVQFAHCNTQLNIPVSDLYNLQLVYYLGRETLRNPHLFRKFSATTKYFEVMLPVYYHDRSYKSQFALGTRNAILPTITAILRLPWDNPGSIVYEHQTHFPYIKDVLLMSLQGLSTKTDPTTFGFAQYNFIRKIYSQLPVAAYLPIIGHNALALDPVLADNIYFQAVQQDHLIYCYLCTIYQNTGLAARILEFVGTTIAAVNQRLILNCDVPSAERQYFNQCLTTAAVQDLGNLIKMLNKMHDLRPCDYQLTKIRIANINNNKLWFYTTDPAPTVTISNFISENMPTCTIDNAADIMEKLQRLICLVFPAFNTLLYLANRTSFPQGYNNNCAYEYIITNLSRYTQLGMLDNLIKNPNIRNTKEFFAMLVAHNIYQCFMVTSASNAAKKIVSTALENFGFNQEEIDLAVALVCHDEIGACFSSFSDKNVESPLDTAMNLVTKARRLKMPVSDFMSLMLLVFIADGKSNIKHFIRKPHPWDPEGLLRIYYCQGECQRHKLRYAYQSRCSILPMLTAISRLPWDGQRGCIGYNGQIWDRYIKSFLLEHLVNMADDLTPQQYCFIRKIYAYLPATSWETLANITTDQDDTCWQYIRRQGTAYCKLYELFGSDRIVNCTMNYLPLPPAITPPVIN